MIDVQLIEIAHELRTPVGIAPPVVAPQRVFIREGELKKLYAYCALTTSSL